MSVIYRESSGLVYISQFAKFTQYCRRVTMYLYCILIAIWINSDSRTIYSCTVTNLYLQVQLCQLTFVVFLQSVILKRSWVTHLPNSGKFWPRLTFMSIFHRLCVFYKPLNGSFIQILSTFKYTSAKLNFKTNKQIKNVEHGVFELWSKVWHSCQQLFTYLCWNMCRVWTCLINSGQIIQYLSFSSALLSY